MIWKVTVSVYRQNSRASPSFVIRVLKNMSVVLVNFRVLDAY